MAAFESVFAKLRERRDTSDFQMSPLLRMMYQYKDSPLMTDELWAEMRDVVLGFKYWIDEPGTDPMVYWSENHEILFHSNEYLAGQLFPNEVFTNSGMTGAEHVEKGRALLLRWMDLRSRIGFTEWHSNNYYEEDWGPLVNLVDFAEEPEIATRAAMLADLLYLDVALYSHEGVFGGSHGRSFERKNTGASESSTHKTAHLLFGQGRFNGTGGVSFSQLSVTKKYVPATAVILAGRAENQPEVWTDKARMSINVEEAAEYGLTTEPGDFESFYFWWSAGSYALVETINGTFEMADTFGLFDSGDFFPLLNIFVPLWEQDLLVPIISGDRGLEALLEGISLQRTNTYAMLSSAQDKLSGGPSFQNFSWSANLGFEEAVFTTHPLQAGERRDDNFSLFSGGASHPRIGQERDVAIIIYNPIIDWPGILFPLTQMTHVYSPFDEFDETRRVGNWTFARDEEGYIGLWSQKSVRVSTESDGRYPGRRLIAEGGPRNVWICEIGWSGEDGSFEDFIARVAAQEIVVTGDRDEVQVTYASDMGEMQLGWTGPLVVDGAEVALDEHPRYSNPFVHVAWGERVFEIEAGGYRSVLDFDTVTRVADERIE